MDDHANINEPLLAVSDKSEHTLDISGGTDIEQISNATLEEVTVPTKVPLLLFSGGMDSTYMLACALDDTPVDILYVNSSQGPNKIAAEKLARQAILGEFRRSITDRIKQGEKNVHYIRKEYEVNLPEDFFDGTTPGKTWVQPVIWMMAALSKIDPDRHSCLRIGYVSGDSITSQVDNITKAWETLQMFTKIRVVPIEFPLIRGTKLEIMKQMPVGLLDKVWFCEAPRISDMADYYQCGHCTPCLTHHGVTAMRKRQLGEE